MTSMILNRPFPSRVSRVRSRSALALIVPFALSVSALTGCSEEEVVVEELLPSVSVYRLQPRTLSEEILSLIHI